MQVIFIDNYFRTFYLDLSKRKSKNGMFLEEIKMVKYCCDLCPVKQKSACQNFILIGFTFYQSI